MASRPGILVSRKIPFESPPPPNQTRDVITIEIRMHFPPNALNTIAGRSLLLRSLFEAYNDANRDVENHFYRA